ncbi:MAG TPA: DUF3048 domain-containing protein [Candidatus Limnocylindria bacterium]|nr:DUF3048 domain-containing protein [Candidatus Limnocylindria bacterium]
MRRALVGLIGISIVGLAVLAGAQIGALGSTGAVSATASLGASSASPTVLPTAAPTLAPPTQPPPTPTPTPQLVPAPLTGLPVTPEAAGRHPIAVMVDDHAGARPQTGFNAASIVWHAPAEGGVPRYMLVFQDEVPGDVGPIRSARQYYVEWAAEWNALYVHHGGSPQALDTLLRKGSGQLVYNADGFRWEGRFVFRVKERLAPHNVMTDGEHLRKLAARVGAEDGLLVPAWSFAADAPFELRPTGGSIAVTYPYEKVTYRYDPLTNTYPRYIDSSKTPQVDAGDGQVVAPKNVVILRMFFGALNDGHPNKHRLEAHNIGTGEAWIATNGHTVKGTWSKASATAPTLLFGPDGEPITLTAGQTFMQVLPLAYPFKIRDGLLPGEEPPPGPSSSAQASANPS